jgi:hypothetical protein
MKTQRMFRRTVLAMALAALATGASAFDVAESEPNGDIWTPQSLGTLAAGGSISIVNGTIDALVFDQDFYTFKTETGAIAKVEVVGAVAPDASPCLPSPWKCWPWTTAFPPLPMRTSSKWCFSLEATFSPSTRHLARRSSAGRAATKWASWI